MLDTPAPAWKPLNSRQRRVLGVLVEKAKTTPDVYPMTINGIVAGCNQKSNREPLMSLSAEDVEQILGELRALGAVAVVQGVGRVEKFRHYFYEWLGIDKAESAVMTELLLRGAQTLGELRGRAARMEPLPDLNALKAVVDLLLKKNLMIELTPSGRGQVVSHNLYKERELVELRAQYAGHSYAGDSYAGNSGDAPNDAGEEGTTAAHAPHAAASPHRVQQMPSAPSTAGTVTRDMFAELEVEVAELRAEMARVREELREMREKLA
jgi:uncharacterized protein YceH (UPF0502 family)